VITTLSRLILIDNPSDGAEAPGDFIAMLQSRSPALYEEQLPSQSSMLDDENFGDEAYVRTLENPTYL